MYIFKYIKTFILFVVCLMNVDKANGQLSDQFSMYMLNKYDFNPAYAGLDFSLSANIIYRDQWQQLPGSPTNFQINGHIPYYIWNGALGGLIERKSVGAITVTRAMGSYNYVMGMPNGLLSFGGRLGLANLSLNGNEIITPEGIYTSGFSHNDPILVEDVDSGFGLSYDFGVYFYNKDIELGLSVAHLPYSSISLQNTGFSQVSSISAYAQYNMQINDELKLEHSILIKSNLDAVQSDVSTLAKINGNVFGGISLRGYSSTSIDAAALILGMKINKKYTLSYSYDFGVSDLRIGHEGSHEIMLNYNLQKFIGTGQPPKIIYNPRYL